jgi:hypothetical protein
MGCRCVSHQCLVCYFTSTLTNPHALLLYIGSYTQNYLNRKKNIPSTKVNSSVLGGLDLAETERGNLTL